MRYLLVFAASTLLWGPVLVALGLGLAPAPIAGEYWVREMVTVKREIARQYRGQRKAFVVAGSSGLFSIDTGQLSRELGIPVVNLSTHLGVPLDSLLGEAARVAEPGDVVIAALEPSYYCEGDGGAWLARNRIAWQPEAWRALTLRQRASALAKLGPPVIAEMALARLEAALLPDSIRRRLDALDDAGTLRRFAARPPPGYFDYSAMHLDDLGNMQRTEAASYRGPSGPRPDATVALCDPDRETLGAFVHEWKARGIQFYFANAPFVANAEVGREAITAASRDLETALARIAPMLDTRADVTYDRDLFFDTYRHLNANGRRIRTALLAEALRSRGVGTAEISSRSPK